MIKFIVAALWIVAATVGATFYAFQAAGARGDDPAPKPLLGGLDYVSTEIISVPIIRGSAVQGYFLTKLVYTVEPKEMAKLSVPAMALITDQVYSYLYANPQIDFSKQDTVDLDKFRNSIRESVNARVGIELIHDVLVNQVNYLSKDDIRDNAIKRRGNGLMEPIMKAPQPKAEAPAEPAAH
ncbi:hypothetical protein MAUB1S_06266 [Mycolicibacterium aubagnense]